MTKLKKNEKKRSRQPGSGFVAKIKSSPEKRLVQSGLRVNGRAVHAEAGVRTVCVAIGCLARRGRGARTVGSPFRLLEEIGVGEALVIKLKPADYEILKRLNTLSQSERDPDCAALLRRVSAGLYLARQVNRDAGKRTL